MYTRTFIYLFIYLFTCLLINSFIHSFIWCVCVLGGEGVEGRGEGILLLESYGLCLYGLLYNKYTLLLPCQQLLFIIIKFNAHTSGTSKVITGHRI